jgi:hypothetical protein
VSAARDHPLARGCAFQHLHQTPFPDSELGEFPADVREFD